MAALIAVPFLSAAPPTLAPALQERLNDVRAKLEKSDYKTAGIEAEALLQEAEGEYGGDSIEAARALALAAEARWRLGRGPQPETRTMVERAIALEERLLGLEDLELARLLTLLGHVQTEAIDYEGSKRSFERALSIRDKVKGPDDPSVGAARRDLAMQLKLMGDFAGARAEYDRALAILETAPGDNDRELAVLLSNYSLLFRDTGELSRALALQRRAVELAQKAFGPEHSQATSFLNNLASLYRLMGRYNEALPLYERVLAERKARLGPGHPFVGTTLRQMGDLMMLMGHVDRAIPFLRESLSVREKAWGPDHPEVALSLSGLADALIASGQLEEARADAERAVKIWEHKFGPDHPDLADFLDKEARSARAQGDVPAAVAAALRGEAVSRSFLRLLARTLPEEQALGFAIAHGESLSVALSAAGEGLPEERRLAVWDSFLRSRQLVLEELAARQQALRVSDDPRVKPLWQRFVVARQRWVDLIVRGVGEGSVEEGRTALTLARDESEKAEEVLALQSAVFKRERVSGALGLADVRRALPRDSALVAYVRYSKTPAHTVGPRAKSQDTPSYLAFVLTDHGSATVPLGAASSLEALVDRWRAEVQRSGEADTGTLAVRRAGAALRRRVWDPLVPRLGTAGHIFVVPDDALSLVNLNALPLAHGRYLVEDRRLIHVLSSERDLVTPDSSAYGKGLLALGDPAYDDASALAMQSPKPGRSETRVAANNGVGTLFRGARPGCPEFQSVHFESLAGTRNEVASIVELLHQAGSLEAADVLALTGAAANETAFKTEAPGHRILHLATHGFFLNGACGSLKTATRGIGGLAPAAGPAPTAPSSPAEPEAEDPLLLSGLALAGANHRSEAGPGEDDGILTAEEIASLDLTGVEWAVLSACDTGVGKIQPGEGILGLSRALRVAGARTTILSLWSVEDASAQRFMTALYRARWTDHRSTAEAMRDAALTVLGERRREGQSDHPFYWAGFVAVGDWR